MSEWTAERIAEYRSMTSLDDVLSMLDEIERLQGERAASKEDRARDRRIYTAQLATRRDESLRREKLLRECLRDILAGHRSPVGLADRIQAELRWRQR